MLGNLFKFILLPIILLVGAAGAAAAYLLLTPVHEGNVRSKIWQACMVSTAIRTANNWGRRSPQSTYSSSQCVCAGDKIVQSMGSNVATMGAEAVRNLIRLGIRGWLSGGGHSSLRNSQHDQIADAFINSATRIARSCDA